MKRNIEEPVHKEDFIALDPERVKYLDNISLVESTQ